MAIIVEDGTGLTNAETYTSVAEATAYFAARGNEAWADVENKEAALRKATDYMMQAYREHWKGYRVKADQALDWPRYQVPREGPGGAFYGGIDYYPHTVVPTEIKNACAELALVAASQDLMPNLERAKRHVSIGPISVSYDRGSAESTRFRAVDMTLRPFLKNLGNGVMRSVERS